MRTAGNTAVLAVFVHPLVVRIEPVVDGTDPFRHGPAVRVPGSSRQLRRVGTDLGLAIEGRDQTGEGGQAPVDALAVDGDEELLGDRQTREVGRQHHGRQSLARPSGVDRLQSEAQARAGRVGPYGGAHRRVIRCGRLRVGGLAQCAVLVPAGRAAGQEEHQRHDDGRPSRPPARDEWRRIVRSPHQVAQRSEVHAGGLVATTVRTSPAATQRSACASGGPPRIARRSR